MDIFDAIKARKSVRSYSDKSVPDDVLEKLVDAGRRAPTARAVEPWEFIVVTDKGALSEIGRLADHGPFIKDAAACIAVYCGDTKYYLEDGCAATENILLAASGLGLGACWVAGDKKAYARDISRLLGVPAEYRLISLIPLGWPAEKPEQSKNRSLDEAYHRERFG